jgi:4-amino-4-deoxy-L-arabinose transferase-like glycosyltransferase
VGVRETLARAPAWARWLGVLTACRIALGAFVPLVPEEAYHWNYARHLDWSYYDHPPMIAWAIALGRLVLGDTPAGVRLVPALLSAATAWLLARMARRLYGEAAATWAVVLFMISPILFIASGTGFPDSPAVFFWALALELAGRTLESGRGPLWLGTGAALGAGMLSKYTTVFLGLSILLFLLWSADHRRWLIRPWPYLGALVALGVFAPVLGWNAAHDWVSFRMQSVDRFEQAQGIHPLWAAKFLAQQWGGALALTLPLAGIALRRGFRSGRWEERLLCFAAVPMIAFFFTLSWSRGIHLLWPMPAYLSVTVLMAGAAAGDDGRLERIYRRARPWVIGVAGTGLAAAGLHAAFFLPWLSPFPGIYGWDAVACRARELRQALPPDAFYVGLGRKYTCASQLAFHLNAPGEVHGKNLLGREGLQYDFWSPRERIEGRDAVVVLEGAERLASLRGALESRFRSVEPAGTLTVSVGRRSLLQDPPPTFYFFVARDYRPCRSTVGGTP